jgi:predicted phosphodiesterase
LIKKYKPDFIVSGHTHVAHILKKKEYTLLNPGSAVKEAVRKSEGSEINYPSYIVGYAQNGNFEFLFSKAIGFKKSKKVKTYSNNDE